MGVKIPVRGWIRSGTDVVFVFSLLPFQFPSIDVWRTVGRFIPARARGWQSAQRQAGCGDFTREDKGRFLPGYGILDRRHEFPHNPAVVLLFLSLPRIGRGEASSPVPNHRSGTRRGVRIPRRPASVVIGPRGPGTTRISLSSTRTDGASRGPRYRTSMTTPCPT